MKVENDHRSKFSNLSNWKEAAWNKNESFNGIQTHDLRNRGTMLYQLSYETTHWEQGLLIALPKGFIAHLVEHHTGIVAKEIWITKTFFHVEAQVGSCLSCWDHQLVTDYCRPAQSPQSVSFSHYYSGIILFCLSIMLEVMSAQHVKP